MTRANVIKNRIATILFRDSTDVALIQSLAGVLVGIGFLIGAFNNNYEALVDLMPFQGWGQLFLIYQAVKVHTLVTDKMPNWMDITNSSLGIWAWNYIFLSFTLFDKVPVAPTELLLMVPVLTEAWSLTSIIYKRSTR